MAAADISKREARFRELAQQGLRDGAPGAMTSEERVMALLDFIESSEDAKAEFDALYGLGREKAKSKDSSTSYGKLTEDAFDDAKTHVAAKSELYTREQGKYAFKHGVTAAKAAATPKYPSQFENLSEIVGFLSEDYFTEGIDEAKIAGAFDDADTQARMLELAAVVNAAARNIDSADPDVQQNVYVSVPVIGGVPQYELVHAPFSEGYFVNLENGVATGQVYITNSTVKNGLVQVMGNTLHKVHKSSKANAKKTQKYLAGFLGCGGMEHCSAEDARNLHELHKAVGIRADKKALGVISAASEGAKVGEDGLRGSFAEQLAQIKELLDFSGKTPALRKNAQGKVQALVDAAARAEADYRAPSNVFGTRRAAEEACGEGAVRGWGTANKRDILGIGRVVEEDVFDRRSKTMKTIFKCAAQQPFNAADQKIMNTALGKQGLTNPELNAELAKILSVTASGQVTPADAERARQLTTQILAASLALGEEQAVIDDKERRVAGGIAVPDRAKLRAVQRRAAGRR